MDLYKVQSDTYCHDETTRMTRADLQIKCRNCQVELKFLPEYLNSLVVCPECLETFKCTSANVLS
jgi:Zn finger protein HypA/HybF involved in hydrogenase expression